MQKAGNGDLHYPVHEKAAIDLIKSRQPAEPLLVKFFERPDSSSGYDVYGEEAERLSGELYRTSSSLATSSYDEQYAVLKILPAALSTALRECLFVQGWKVELYAYESKCYRLQRAGSPGNLSSIEDLIDEDDAQADLPASPASAVDAVVVAFCVDSPTMQVGIAYVRGDARQLGTSLFPDNDLMLNFETVLVQLNAKELLLPGVQNHKEYSKAREIAKNLGILVTELRPAEFSESLGEQDMVKLVRSSEFVERPALVYKSISALASYLRLLAVDGATHTYTLHDHHWEQYMRLDDTALRSLNLFSSARSADSAKGGRGPVARSVDSLYSLLNRCRTAQGARLLGQWIRQPLRSVELIDQRLDVVEALTRSQKLRQALSEGLTGCSDMARCSRKMARGRAGLLDLVVYYQTINKASSLASAIDHPLLVKFFRGPAEALVKAAEPFQEMLRGSLDFSALDRHEYIIKAEFDSELQELSRAKSACMAQMEMEHVATCRQTGLERHKKVKLERSPLYGYHFRCSRLDSGLLAKAEKLIEYSVQKTGVYFASPALKKLSEEYKSLEQQYSRKQSGLVQQLVQSSRQYLPAFEQLNTIIAILDVSLALAEVSILGVRPYVRPRFSADASLSILGCRHPILEELMGAEFIQNDLTTAGTEARFAFITGPNMGGKSTFMRQTAVCAILAQLGCFVPCASYTAPVFDAVLVRVGAGDDIMRGVSTFMAEMLEVSAILRAASERSLVLIDELGRGTSTTEGFGLAWAISKHIAGTIRPACCLFATHFHELAALAVDFPSLMTNLHVDALVEETPGRRELRLLYKVVPGASDKSFGIECAKLAHFPKSVLRRAYLYQAIQEGRLSAARNPEAHVWLDSLIGALGATEAGEEREVALSTRADSAPEALKGLLADLLSC